MGKLQGATSWDVILNFSGVPGTATLAYTNGYVYHNFNGITMYLYNPYTIGQGFPW